MDIDEVAIQEHFAFRSIRPLAECCAIIQRAFDLSDFTFDSENVTEWGYTLTGDLEYNLSREYDVGTLQDIDPSTPGGCNFGFVLQVSRNHPLAKHPDRVISELARPLAQALANTLNTTVHYHRSWRGRSWCRPISNIERSETFFDPESLAKRLPIWIALSDLFLDSRLDQSHFKSIALDLRNSEFTPAEIEDILWKEVFPALADNLRIITGEWGHFSEDWLQDRILNVLHGSEVGMGRYGVLTADEVQTNIADAWAEVSKYLSD